MILAPMRFAGYTWHYNPKTINITCKKNTVENKIHNSDSVVQCFGRTARIISGEGYIFGDDCFERMEELWNLYRNKTEGVLTVPEFAAVRAVFTDLKLVGDAKDKLIKYLFSFTEVMKTESMRSPLDTHTALNGESLWDVAYRYSLSVEKLLSLNPDLKDPYALTAGKQVNLC